VHNNDKVIAVYGTPYDPGQMVALKIQDIVPTNAAAGPVVIDRSQVELWANDLSTSTSSPILAGDRIYGWRKRVIFAASTPTTARSCGS